MLQRLEPHYTMVPVERIEYEHEGRLLDTSAALAADAHLRSRVHVVYRNGTEVYVNGSADPWRVAGPWGEVELPQWGYVGWSRRGDVVACSALLPMLGPEARRGPRQRVDLSLGDGQLYADSRGGFAMLGPIAVEGAAALKREEGQWWVIPATRFADFAFRPDCLGGPPLLRRILGKPRDLDVEPVARDGSETQAPELRWSRGLLHITQAPELRWSRGLLHILPRSKGEVKYRITPARRRRPSQIEHDDPLAILGRRVHITLPRDVVLHQDGLAWEIAGAEQPVAGAVLDGRMLTCAVPPAKPGSHIWLRMPAEERTLWLDFIAAEPLEARLLVPQDTRLEQGEPLPVEVVVKSHLRRPATVHAVLRASPPLPCEPEALDVDVPASGTARGAFRLTLPWKPATYRVTASAGLSGRDVAAEATLRAAWDHPVVADLADASLACDRGYCTRGGAEMPLSGDLQQGEFRPARFHSGAVERQCLFSHPPYGKYRAGYVFAAYSIELPGEAAAFDFWLGMRSAPGIDPTDGATYKVVVLDAAGKAHELFSEHYAAREWKRAEVDLARFAGQGIRLKLIADCGPKDNTTADHTLWGEPRVVLRTKLLRITH